MKTKNELIQSIMKVLQNIDRPEITEEMKVELYRLTSQFIHLMLANTLAGFADSILETQEFITRQLKENIVRITKKKHQDNDKEKETIH